MIRYRQPLKDDKAICGLVFRELLPVSYKIRDNIDIDYRFVQKDVKKRLYKGTTFVAVNRQKVPFAFIHLIPKKEELFIDMLAVDKKLQSKGWGARLLSLGERYAAARNMRSVTLFVDILNSKAQRFYASKGYRLQSFHPQIQCYRLTKSL
ncbi:hypothetical protein SY83_08425 [Paenibacillus swuensis]|uniref:N-acetyltransferase domain-containing protein n=1 Tax=Paenibacillus swuensis TaxID=1178515 RepID=A0A172TGX7_9BACL|nr:GNAT family N-acetyltransferase [Paenibacillus swuensis]ANE46295.1 hypothetical protein SY83_08425 [Paenibacillus swuensis]